MVRPLELLTYQVISRGNATLSYNGVDVWPCNWRKWFSMRRGRSPVTSIGFSSRQLDETKKNELLRSLTGRKWRSGRQLATPVNGRNRQGMENLMTAVSRTPRFSLLRFRTCGSANNDTSGRLSKEPLHPAGSAPDRCTTQFDVVRSTNLRIFFKCIKLVIVSGPSASVPTFHPIGFK
jgi:hypothetical protein